MQKRIMRKMYDIWLQLVLDVSVLNRVNVLPYISKYVTKFLFLLHKLTFQILYFILFYFMRFISIF